MAATATEKIGGISFGTNSLKVSYEIVGAADEAEAQSTLAAAAAGTRLGLTRSNVSADETDVVGYYEGTVEYTPPAASQEQQNQAGTSGFTFDTSGGTQHIAQAKHHVADYPTGTAPNHEGAINVVGDDVEGVDKIVGQFAFTITKRFAVASVTESYMADLMVLTGTINDDDWSVVTDDGISLNFAAEEALLKGVQGAVRNGIVELQFSFGVFPNKTGGTESGITYGAKKGWDYLWMEFGTGTSNNSKVKIPLAIHIERVYDLGDFSLLGI